MQPEREAVRPREAGWPYTPHLVVFFCSAFIMIVELVAGRLIARHVGSSLYTWTSIIGVILAGISLGNYLGGRLADRRRAEALLGPLFLLASAAALAVLLLNNCVTDLHLFAGLSWPTRTFLTVLFVFFGPAAALGTIGPVAAKMAVERGAEVGRALGGVYAWGAAGSIGGTFLTGFWLIAALGSRGVVLAVAFGLALLSTLLGPRRLMPAFWTAVLGVFLALSQLSADKLPLSSAQTQRIGFWENPAYKFARDGNYQFVYVEERDSRSDTLRKIRVLRLDYLIHAYVDPDDPQYLEYGYERIYRDILLRRFEGKASVASFFLGGGGYCFPRWIQSRWPESKLDVAEIDPAVVAANHEALGLPKDTAIRTLVGDARNVIDDLPRDARYDLVLGDAFTDLSVPFHLTTVEFVRKVREHLAPGGIYMVNIIDDWEFGRFLAASVRTLQEVFPQVTVFCTNVGGVKKARDTFVLVASDVPLDTAGWELGHWNDFPGSALSSANLEDLFARCGERMLTDDDAPVENLLAPVVGKRD